MIILDYFCCALGVFFLIVGYNYSHSYDCVLDSNQITLLYLFCIFLIIFCGIGILRYYSKKKSHNDEVTAANASKVLTNNKKCPNCGLTGMAENCNECPKCHTKL